MAFRRAADLRRAGTVGTFEEMVVALHADTETREWTAEKGEPNNQRELRRLWDRTGPAAPEGVGLGDFWAYMPHHKYIFAPSRDLWPGASVNARVPPVLLLDDAGDPVLDDEGKPVKIRASAWLDRHQAVETMTWAPGEPMILRNLLATESAIIERQGVTELQFVSSTPGIA